MSRIHHYLSLVFLAASACATAPSGTTLAVPAKWLTSTPDATITELRLADDGVVTLGAGPRVSSDVRIVHDGNGDRLVRGARELTPYFPAIDSFDVSTQRGEVVFSARRADNFDIGLVSTDGSPIHWVPEDPADETSVSWAPRGNKVSYVVHAGGTDLIRTVHVPTAAQLTVDLLPHAVVTGLAWDPSAEHFAVAWESLDGSSRVEVMKYSGENRHVAIPPAVQLDVELETLASAAVMRPRALRYGERVPLVVWIDESNAPRWDSDRGALMKNARVACAVVHGVPDAAFWSAFWSAARETAWLDMTRVFVVGGAGESNAGLSIRGDASIPPGQYRRTDNSVLTAPAIVKSFSAGFIAGQLKGTSPANGSSR
jgi:hypothetical protein